MDDQELGMSDLTLKLSEICHERGLSLPTLTVFFSGDVSDESVERFVKNLHVLSSLSDEKIEVVLNSTGGDVYAGLAMYDAIRICPCPIDIAVLGSAMSMGSVILQAAKVRLMT